jgi:hypothetical protein
MEQVIKSGRKFALLTIARGNEQAFVTLPVTETKKE